MRNIFSIVAIFAGFGMTTPALGSPCSALLSGFAINNVLNMHKAAASIALNKWETLVNEVATKPYTLTELRKGKVAFQRLYQKIDLSGFPELRALNLLPAWAQFYMACRSSIDCLKFHGSSFKQDTLAKELVEKFWENPFRPRDLRLGQERIFPPGAQE